MNFLIALAAGRPRVVFSVLAMLLIAGTVAFLTMPREAMPTVPIPIVMASVALDGVSPSDAERLVARPMEEQFQSLDGLKEMRATAFQGGASIVLEFDANVETEDAMNDVRAAMDRVRPLLPDQVREPMVRELDFTQRPVLTISLAADLPERTLLKFARDLRDRITSLPAVLNVDISGVREEQVEIVIDPLIAQNYGINQDELFRLVSRSNRLVAAGELETDRGRFSVTVPGLFESLDDIYNLPVKSSLTAVVKLKDIAEIRRTFKDRTTYVRVNGKPAVSVDVTRRADANVVEMSQGIRTIVNEFSRKWPDNLTISYPVDDSLGITGRVTSLVNGVITSIVIVMAVCMASMGIRSGLLVGIAIPGSFLTGILAMSLLGITLNVMALFGLILACGMLVDAAIVVVEAADNYMKEGQSPKVAYVRAAQRMAWPIISSTLTTIAAFVPLLLWPGLTGKFFSYLPITVICVLTASLVMSLYVIPSIAMKFTPDRTQARSVARVRAASALPMSSVADDVAMFAQSRDRGAFRRVLEHYMPRIKSYFMRLGASDKDAEGLASQSMTEAWNTSDRFDPARQTSAGWIFSLVRTIRLRVLGGVHRPEPQASDLSDNAPQTAQMMTAADRRSDPFDRDMDPITRGYASLLRAALTHAGKVVMISVVLLVVVLMTYMKSGNGIVFFPATEPERAIMLIHARGNLSLEEKDSLIREIERRILAVSDLEAVYTRTGRPAGAGDVAADVIGQFSLSLKPWDQRRVADEVLADINARVANIPGIEIITEKIGGGPPRGGPPVALEVSSNDPRLLNGTVTQIRAAMDIIGGFTNVEDSRPLPGIEWQLRVNREEAAKYGADIALIGQSVQLVTNGLKLGAYRPDDSTEEIDIIVRYPLEQRSMRALDEVRIETARGAVPISNFVERIPEQQAGEISRVDAQRVMTINADVARGKFAGAQIGRLKAWLAKGELNQSVRVSFKGEQRDSEESGSFLGQALLLALFLIAIVLLMQFDSFFVVFLVLTAVVMSTIGVFLGLLIFDQPFSVVMTGIGVITLAGIVVNNNIILIDAYQEIAHSTFTSFDAALRTGIERLRPVLLTTGTTIVGLLPMALGMNIDFFARTFSIGDPSSGWWAYLAQAIVYGLTFSTVLTLIVTPCALLVRENARLWWRKVWARITRSASPEPTTRAPMPEAAE
ncbi:MAG: AcrB/AcrD/AcrF family protein [Alphaproteobacteria bacterium]|nr:AcrB/AcrD/AcrF family protein [Alphaproteobacteria bacterium]PHY01691.1 MAG: MFS transporter [Rhodospirillaceae bacterium]